MTLGIVIGLLLIGGMFIALGIVLKPQPDDPEPQKVQFGKVIAIVFGGLMVLGALIVAGFSTLRFFKGRGFFPGDSEALPLLPFGVTS